MRICHVTASVTASGGGIPIALQCLSAAQSRLRILPRVVGHEDGGALIDHWPDGCLSPVSVRRFPGMPWAFAMNETLRNISVDLSHIHGLWSQASILVPRFSRSQKIPYLVSPHGMLDHWALSHSHWKKRIAAFLYENRSLRGAACLHALCSSEKESIRAYGIANPVCVIPNGVDLPEEIGEVGDRRSEAGKRILLFLGRLHPKKGLLNALKAWKQVGGQRSEVGGREEWQFVIAGWDQGGHEAELKRLCDELGLAYADVPASDFTDHRQPITDNSASVLFTGPAFGEQKDALLRRSSAFILPSFSEGLPMAVLEAWSYGLPVLMTDHCNLPEGFIADAAIRIGTDVESIANGMHLLFRSPSSDLRSLGLNGRALVERQFTWPMVAGQMKEVYEWLLGGGPAPAFMQK